MSQSYVIDRRDIRFVQKEYLQIQQLTQYAPWDDFSEEDFDLMVQEGNVLIEREIAPLNASGDREGCTFDDNQVKTPKGYKQAWEKLAEGGWIGINSNPDFGGQGLPISVAVGVLESMYGSNPSLYVTAMLTAGAAGLITEFGEDWQKKLYAEPMLNGQFGGTMCLSEPDAGTAVGDITTKATLRADGSYNIQGVKCWITGGDHDLAKNIVHLVLGRVEGAPRGAKGVSLFIVPKYKVCKNGELGQANNVSTVRIEEKLGLHASPTCVLEFGGKGECQGFLLQGPNRGLTQMFKLMNEARYVVAFQGLGAASGAFQCALHYAKERVQGVAIEYGKNPDAPRTAIIHHPDVRNNLLTMKAIVEGARAFIYDLGLRTDLVRRGPEKDRAFQQDLVDILTPIAKNYGAEQGFDAVRLGIQVLGGVGFTEEFPIAQHLRDVKIASIYEGTTGVQALDLVVRKLGKDKGRLLKVLMNSIADLKPKGGLPSSLRNAIGAWRKTANALPSIGRRLYFLFKTKGPRHAVLNATDISAYFGDVMVCYHLLKMALIAHDKLQAMQAGQDLAHVLEENEEARFYFNKIKAAEHYAFQILPRSQAVLQRLKNKHFAALEAVL